MVVVGIIGYVENANGYQQLGTVWATHFSEEFKRRLYKKWVESSKKKAFTKYLDVIKNDPEKNVKKLNEFRQRADMVRVIAHTQVKKTGVGQKKGHIMEIQVNGGSIPEKVNFAEGLLETQVRANSI